MAVSSHVTETALLNDLTSPSNALRHKGLSMHPQLLVVLTNKMVWDMLDSTPAKARELVWEAVDFLMAVGLVGQPREGVLQALRVISRILPHLHLTERKRSTPLAPAFLSAKHLPEQSKQELTLVDAAAWSLLHIAFLPDFGAREKCVPMSPMSPLKHRGFSHEDHEYDDLGGMWFGDGIECVDEDHLAVNRHAVLQAFLAFCVSDIGRWKGPEGKEKADEHPTVLSLMSSLEGPYTNHRKALFLSSLKAILRRPPSTPLLQRLVSGRRSNELDTSCRLVVWLLLTSEPPERNMYWELASAFFLSQSPRQLQQYAEAFASRVLDTAVPPKVATPEGVATLVEVVNLGMMFVTVSRDFAAALAQSADFACALLTVLSTYHPDPAFSPRSRENHANMHIYNATAYLVAMLAIRPEWGACLKEPARNASGLFPKCGTLLEMLHFAASSAVRAVLDKGVVPGWSLRPLVDAVYNTLPCEGHLSQTSLACLVNMEVSLLEGYRWVNARFPAEARKWFPIVAQGTEILSFAVWCNADNTALVPALTHRMDALQCFYLNSLDGLEMNDLVGESSSELDEMYHRHPPLWGAAELKKSMYPIYWAIEAIRENKAVGGNIPCHEGILRTSMCVTLYSQLVYLSNAVCVDRLFGVVYQAPCLVDPDGSNDAVLKDMRKMSSLAGTLGFTWESILWAP